jgi:hypothetical protein
MIAIHPSRPSGTAQSGLRTIRIIARLNVGGPAQHAVLLDAGLRTRGFDTLLVHGSVAPGEAEMAGLAADRGVPARRIPALGRRIGLTDDLTSFLAVFRLIRDLRPDVVHTHTAKAMSSMGTSAPSGRAPSA